MVDLGTLPGALSSEALGINDAGSVVGWSDLGDGVSHAFLWRNGRMTDLGTLGGDFAVANGINDRGQIVGWRELVPLENAGAFLWDRGRVTDLPSLTGAGGGAHAINNHGVIVGRSPAPGDPFGYGYGHAVLWR